jgi:hypothetical protein
VRIFLLLLATSTRVVSGRSRLMRTGFPIGTHRCRSSEEAHSLLGQRVCTYHARWTLSQKFWLSFEASFVASPFVNSNTWHLICYNFNLNFIWYCILMCFVFVFSLHWESPIWYWETKPSFLRWFCHTRIVMWHLPLLCELSHTLSLLCILVVWNLFMSSLDYRSMYYNCSILHLVSCAGEVCWDLFWWWVH